MGILIMSHPFFLNTGLFFDSRSILMSVTGMFLSPPITLIAMVCLSLFRVVLGGVGTFAGVGCIISSGALGMLWHTKRYTTVIEGDGGKGLEFYLFGVIVHIVMILDFFLMPSPLNKEVISSIALPVLVFFPFGNYLMSMLFYFSLKQQQMVHHIQKSEHLFKTMFEIAPVGIALTDSRTGKMLDVNRSLISMLGYSKEELLNSDWKRITHPDDIESDDSYMEELLRGEIKTYTLDKRFKRSDGSYCWTNIAVSSIFDTQEQHQRHFCMINDISSRKETEDKIRYAYLHDQLTGLPNQFHFMNTLHQIKEEKRSPVHLIIGDINGFKLVNDAFNREVGDELLVNISQILVQEMSTDDYCARIGGDEFALIVQQKDEEYVCQLMKNIQTRVETLAKNKVVVSISFGTATVSGGVFAIDEIVKHAENELNQNKLYESPSSRSKALNTFIHTLHEKNPREELHSRRVSVLSARLSKAIGMGSNEVSKMKTVGLLHDIGKISIDESILNKKGKLSEKEWSEMQKHPEKGYRILLSVGELGELANYVLSHHERIDGKGYPQGLKGEHIPLQSRIIAIADSFDAMTAWRPYKESMSEQEAAKELLRCSGAQFDAALVSIFVEQVLQLPHLLP